MENETNNGGKKLIIVVIVIVIIAIIAAIWLSVRGPKGGEQMPAATLGFEAAQEANQQASLGLGPQYPGAVVYVSSANLPAGGWVVIRKNEAGVAGAVIGSSFFASNARLGNVDLLEPTVEGGNYFAEVYTDDGDGLFDATSDKLVMKADGSPLRVPFTATVNLPEVKG